MLSLRHPDEATVVAHLERQSGLAFSHDGVALTRKATNGIVPDLPAGYRVDHNRVKLGTGADVFGRAQDAVRGWEMFALEWVELFWRDTPIEVGRTVGILVKAGLIWTLNACRIVYVIDEADRFGFGYGTLPDHAESGEERFLVERDPADGSVWYELLAFSRPAGFATRLAGRYARAMQKRFARHSLLAMSNATA